MIISKTSMWKTPYTFLPILFFKNFQGVSKPFGATFMQKQAPYATYIF